MFENISIVSFYLYVILTVIIISEQNISPLTKLSQTVHKRCNINAEFSHSQLKNRQLILKNQHYIL